MSTALLTQAFTTAKGAAPAAASTGDGFAVFQVDDVKAAHAPAFADFKPHVLNDYREQKAPELLNAQLNKLARAREGAERSEEGCGGDERAGEDERPGGQGRAGAGCWLDGGPERRWRSRWRRAGFPGRSIRGRTGLCCRLTDKQEPTADDIAKNLSATREKLLNAAAEEIFRTYAGDADGTV